MAILVQSDSQPKKQQHASFRSAAMTLVEVLVALAVVSFVFSSLTQMTFDALKRAKKLELQDKMRAYASEAVQVIISAKNANWQDEGGFTKILPPVTNGIGSQAYLSYENGRQITSLPPAECTFDETTGYITGGDCQKVIPPETSERNLIFGRVIKRTDDDTISGLENIGDDTANDAEITVVVACIEGVCDAKDFPPFAITFKVYRTGAAQ